MKLRELREQYEAPKTEPDDLEDDFETIATPWDAAKRAMREITGVDLAHGVDTGATLFKCTRCQTVLLMTTPTGSELTIAACPKCDACGLCGRCYDRTGTKLDVKEAIAISVEIGEIVEKKLRLCPDCLASETARLRGYVLP